jgi:hypothetical protein
MTGVSTVACSQWSRADADARRKGVGVGTVSATKTVDTPLGRVEVTAVSPELVTVRAGHCESCGPITVHRVGYAMVLQLHRRTTSWEPREPRDLHLWRLGVAGWASTLPTPSAVRAVLDLVVPAVSDHLAEAGWFTTEEAFERRYVTLEQLLDERAAALRALDAIETRIRALL